MHTRIGLIALFLVAGCSQTHQVRTHVEDHGRTHVDPLIRTAQTEGEIHEFKWLPLCHLELDRFSSKLSPGYPDGYHLREIDAFGPLGSVGFVQDSHYQPEGALYEQRVVSTYLWGLFRRDTSRIRVFDGWREEARVSAILGILNWGPWIAYVPDPSSLSAVTR